MHTVRLRSRRQPELSIVIAAYNMARELPRTVYSLSRSYQRGIDNLKYEIVVVDNGSPVPIDRVAIEAIAPEVRVMYTDGYSASPAKAVNSAVGSTSGHYVCVVLDGARLVTPGVLALARAALALDEIALVTTFAWHLGPQHQTLSQQSGYSAAVEDDLLKSIDWPGNGYRLFEIAALAYANPLGWFGTVNESCCTFLSRESFVGLGGYDESFTSPGGGYVNLDFFSRASERSKTGLIVLLGEGSFHQIHGGVATNAIDPGKIDPEFRSEYERVRGRPYVAPSVDPLYIGRVSSPAMRWLEPRSTDL
jgi:glycosyltransferase involved in cell wall biosynthesis